MEVGQEDENIEEHNENNEQDDENDEKEDENDDHISENDDQDDDGFLTVAELRRIMTQLGERMPARLNRVKTRRNLPKLL